MSHNSTEGRALYIILDASSSMEGRYSGTNLSRYEVARNKLRTEVVPKIISNLACGLMLLGTDDVGQEGVRLGNGIYRVVELQQENHSKLKHTTNSLDPKLGSRAGSPIFEAIKFAISELNLGSYQEKTILVFSDGMDTRLAALKPDEVAAEINELDKIARLSNVGRGRDGTLLFFVLAIGELDSSLAEVVERVGGKTLLIDGSEDERVVTDPRADISEFLAEVVELTSDDQGRERLLRAASDNRIAQLNAQSAQLLAAMLDIKESLSTLRDSPTLSKPQVKRPPRASVIHWIVISLIIFSTVLLWFKIEFSSITLTYYLKLLTNTMFPSIAW